MQKEPETRRRIRHMSVMDFVSEMKIEDNVDGWQSVMFIFNGALKEVGTKIDILHEEFLQTHEYNPIEHIKARIKTPDSIVKKLRRYGYESTIENMVKEIKDVAGIRVVCSFTEDIYTFADMLERQGDLEIISIKDYIRHPKISGYQSYHMIVRVPVYLSDKVVHAEVEIQIRTVAQDFWASLEHKIYYKFEGSAPESISKELRNCARIVADLDAKMEQLNTQIQEFALKQEG